MQPKHFEVHNANSWFMEFSLHCCHSVIWLSNGRERKCKDSNENLSFSYGESRVDFSQFLFQFYGHLPLLLKGGKSIHGTHHMQVYISGQLMTRIIAGAKGKKYENKKIKRDPIDRRM